MHYYTLTCSIISRDGNVVRLHLECGAERPVSVTLGKNMSTPVVRVEGQYDHQMADWQMSGGDGSDWATIRCGRQVALLACVGGRIFQRSGDLPVNIVSTSPVGSVHSSAYARIA
jgi:hypothetical protein